MSTIDSGSEAGEVQEGLDTLESFSILDLEETTRGIAEEHFSTLTQEEGKKAAEEEVIARLTPGPEIHISEVNETTGISLETVTISSIKAPDSWYPFRLGIEEEVNEQTLEALREDVEKNAAQYAEAVLESYMRLEDFESFGEMLSVMGYTQEMLEGVYKSASVLREEHYKDITNAAYFMIQDEQAEPLYTEEAVLESLERLYGQPVFIYESKEADPKEKSATMLLFVDRETGMIQLRVGIITGIGTPIATRVEDMTEEERGEERYLEGLRIHELTHLVYAARMMEEGEVVKAVLSYGDAEWVARAAQGTTYKEALFFTTLSEASYKLTDRIDAVFAKYRKENEGVEDFKKRIEKNEADLRETITAGIKEAIIKDAHPEEDEWTVATPIPGSGILVYGPFFKAVYGADLMKALLLNQEAANQGIKTPEELVELAMDMQNNGEL